MLRCDSSGYITIAPGRSDMQMSSKRATKLLGISVLALAAFSLYLAIADFAAWYGTATLPLEGRLSNDFVFPLIIFSLLGSIIVNKRRRLESA